MLNYNDNVVKDDLKSLANENVKYERLQDKSVLVTGANGMLATYLVYYFMYLNDTKNTNIKIYLLSRNADKLNKKFMDGLDRKDIFTVTQDVCSKIEIEDNIDYIIHMASLADPYNILNNPMSIIESNVLGTLNVLNLAKEKDAEVIFTSTREIYGKMPEDVTRIKETDMGALDCFNQRSCYPESKRLAETMLVNYQYQYGVNFKNLRIAHAYGPGMNIENDGRIMADLICDAVHGRDIVLKSKGEAMRAFCYITDAVAGILYVLLNGNINESYNIANETEEIAIKDLAELIANLYNVEVKYEISNDTRGYTNFKRVGLDTTKLEELGWEPKVKLKDGIERTVNSFKK